MLTGDNEVTAASVANALGIDEFYAGLLPNQKVEKVETLLGEGKKLAFVGDGINDAPVLSRADIGIAMGSLGSDAAIEASDIVLMDDDIRSTILDELNTFRLINRIAIVHIQAILFLQISV